MSGVDEIVKHVFYNPVAKKIYTLHVSPDIVKQIETAQMYNYAKSCYEDNQESLQAENYQHPGTSSSQDEVVISSEESNDVSNNVTFEDQAYNEVNNKNRRVLSENESNQSCSKNQNVSSKNKSRQSYSKKCSEENYKWDYEATKALILSYGSHQEDLDHPVRFKFVWDNITNDLVSQKFDIDKKICQSKWNNLLRSYKSKKDRTGSAPTRFQFYDLMNEIIGDKPSNSSNYTKSSLKTKKNENCGKKNFNAENEAIPDEEEAKKNDNREIDSKKRKELSEKKCENQKTSKSNKAKRKKHVDEDYEYKRRNDERRLTIQERRLKIEAEKLQIDRMKINIFKEHIDSKKNLNKE